MVALAESLFAHIQEPCIETIVSTEESQLGSGRQQVIDLILQTNRSATRSWLDRFDDEALRHYLLHLQASMTPRGRAAFWVRTAAVPAITMADAPE